MEWVEPWQNRWKAAETGWDQGGPHPYLATLWQTMESLFPQASGAQIYSAGCGRAHNENTLAVQGFRVTASDFVPEAIAAARALYENNPHLTLLCADAFIVPESEWGAFDVVFDRAMLCAIQPKLRRDYLRATWQRLRPGGLFAGIPFTARADASSTEGPPFAITPESLLELVSSEATLVHWQNRPSRSNPGSILEEATMIWRKRW